MVILYKNVANTVRYLISTNESMANCTVSLTLGDITKSSPAAAKMGSFQLSSAEVSALSFGDQFAVVNLYRGDELIQRLHVQTRVASEGDAYDNLIAITYVGECNNQSESRYTDIYEYYLHNGTMYKVRTGSGTAQDPYVYSQPVTPETTKIYIDAATGKWYRWNTELAVPAYTEFGASAITNTSQLTNDGEDGVHPFVDSSDLDDLAAAVNFDEDWISGTTYAVGATCVHDGLWYKCLVQNSDTTFTASKWQTISVKANLNVSSELLSDGTLKVNFGIV